MVDQLIGDAEAEHRHKDVVIAERFEHGRTEATGKGSLFHGHHLADPTGERVNQSLVEWSEETGVHNSGLNTGCTEKLSGDHRTAQHGAIGDDQEVVTGAEGFTTPNR